MAYNKQVMQNPGQAALAQQQLRQQQAQLQQQLQSAATGNIQVTVNAQGEQVLALTDANGQRLLGTPDLFYNNATGKLESTLQAQQNAG